MGDPFCDYTESNRWTLLTPAMNRIFEGQEYMVKWDFRNVPLDRPSEPLYCVPRKTSIKDTRSSSRLQRLMTRFLYTIPGKTGSRKGTGFMRMTAMLVILEMHEQEDYSSFCSTPKLSDCLYHNS